MCKFVCQSLNPCLPHSSDTKLFLVHHPNGVIPTAAQDAPLALTTTTRNQNGSSNSSSSNSSNSSSSRSPAAAATSPPFPVTVHQKTKTLGSFGSLLRSSSSLDVTLASRKRAAPVRPRKSPAKSSLAGLLGASAQSSKCDVHRWRDSDESSGEEHEEEDDDDLEDEDSGSSLSGELIWSYFFR